MTDARGSRLVGRLTSPRSWPAGVAGWIRRWIIARLLARNPWVAIILWVLGILQRSHRAAEDVPLLSIPSDGPVGADFFERTGLAGSGTVAGQVDHLDDFARTDATAGNPDTPPDTDSTADRSSSGFDPNRVQPAVRRFYERTAAHSMAMSVRWSRGFRLGARLASLLTSRIRQLNLPGRTTTGWLPLDGRLVAIDPAAVHKESSITDLRGWVRTRAIDSNAPTAEELDTPTAEELDTPTAEELDTPTAEIESDAVASSPDHDEAVFVAIYGTYARDGERFVTIGVPLPSCTLCTVLRVRNWHDGIELTTAGPGDPGLYLVTPVGPFRLPLRQRFRTWSPAGYTPVRSLVRGILGSRDASSGDVHATHRMWFWRIPFLRIDYRIDETGDE